jgi:hypothetical protein
MAASNTSNVIGLQKEKVLSNLPKLFLMGEDKVITDIMRNGGLGSVAVSKRSLRIPLQIAPGGKGRLTNFDGGTLGRGSSINTVPGFVSTKGFLWALESTTEAYWGTDSQDKAITSLNALEQAQEMENFKQFLDALFFSPSGTLGVITAITGSVITVANANNFYNGQDVLFYPSLGGTVRSAVSSTVQTADANNKQITLTAAPPAGTAVGDLVMVDGSPGTAGSSLSSLYDYHVSANIGTVLTLNRATYPGQLNAVGFAAGGSALTPAMVRLILQMSIRNIGTKNIALLNSLKFIVGVEQAAAWENAGTAISQIFRNIPLGKTAFDPLNGTTPDQMAGRELITQLHGDPTRVDSMLMKNWGMATTKSLGPYSPPGSSQTVFPVTSITDGSVVASNLKYWALEADVFNINPRQEAFISGLLIPANY